MIDRHNALFLYLVFLALQFVAIVTFFPNTPIYDEQITVVSELDDGETGKKGKMGSGLQYKRRKPSRTGHAVKHVKRHARHHVSRLSQFEPTVKMVALAIYGLEAFLTLPFAVFGILSLNSQAKQKKTQVKATKRKPTGKVEEQPAYTTQTV